VVWSNAESFSYQDHRISFHEATDVRGRIGLRAGTSNPIWPEVTMQPFVVGSLWGNFSDDDNKVRFVSFNTVFPTYADEVPEVWGEVSLGVNFFNPSQLTSVFAKADLTFGDDISGFAAKGGMRVSW
jgi:outer membrane autotransporter protein